MSSTQSKRLRIREVYSSASWKSKVDKMSESQVIAIFTKFLREGKIK